MAHFHPAQQNENELWTCRQHGRTADHLQLVQPANHVLKAADIHVHVADGSRSGLEFKLAVIAMCIGIY